MKLPDDLIQFICIRDFYIGSYPGLVEFLKEHQQDNTYYLDIQPETTLRFQCRLFSSKESFEYWKESERIRDLLVGKARKQEQERKKRDEVNPIIIALRDAIQSEDFEKVLQIKQIMKKAGYNTDNIKLKQLIKNKLSE